VAANLQSLCVLIPAYEPAGSLVATVQELLGASVQAAVIVDDGSTATCAWIFDRLRRLPGVQVLRHSRNLGKGAAIKTGLVHVASTCPWCQGVVTADADGQHSTSDILRVAHTLADAPGRLVLGARSFDSGTPLRSRIGNQLSRLAVGLLAGQWLRDTQTGLRGIPRQLFDRLRTIRTEGYEFELDMLIAAKHAACEIIETPISTIYLDGNRASHFNPWTDSMRIYFVLLRFGLVSLLTAAIDNIVFAALFWTSGSILSSQAAGRLAGVLFQYSAARSAVFMTSRPHSETLPRYLLLAATSGAFSYLLIRLLSGPGGMSVIPAKLLAETLLFFVNFAISRDYVFTEPKSSAAVR
jgi:glycosyltransferase involved in cell wall biosynthesis